ncbi:MAG: ABC transporter ATP-binding protein [Firmicutes bacterium]|nr:ABC transporter ATP-binding protein [Bacillota bacterium]
MSNSKGKKRTAALRTLHYIKSYTPLIVVSLLFAAVNVLLTLYIPIVVGDAIDLMIGAGRVDFAALKPLLIRVVACATTAALAQWLMSLINNRVTYCVVRDVRGAAFKKLQILPLSYIDSQGSGDIISRMVADVDQFADGLLMGFSQFFTGIMTIICTLVFMLKLNFGIALVVIFITPVSLFVAAFIAKRTYSMFNLQSRTRAEQTSLIDEMITEQKVVRAFGYEQHSQQRFDDVNERLRRHSLRATFFSSITNPSTRFVNALVYAGVGLTGALAAIGGGISVGGLSCFLNYAGQYTKPFNEISGVIAELQNALACAERIFDLIETEGETPDDGKTALPQPLRGEVRFEDVSFSYSPDRPLLQNINLDVRVGQHVAIVCPTGCGKTTLINLLMRFFDVNGGRIVIDGEDIRDVTRQSLRNGIGMVLQETWLQSGTIRDNITLGKPDATQEEVVAAAKAAHAHSFIKRLPKGYDTVIGEDGGSLSQGQRQLLCITRLMLCNPPMLILDEATSSIDTRTEQRIQRAFANLMEGRTTFIVAHRLSTIREADMILVMKDGNIIEQGTHAELLAADGFYRTLYNSQFAK